MTISLSPRLADEFLGTAFLPAVVGSGVMGERLANGNVALSTCEYNRHRRGSHRSGKGEGRLETTKGSGNPAFNKFTAQLENSRRSDRRGQTDQQARRAGGAELRKPRRSLPSPSRRAYQLPNPDAP
ncbi:MAG TPA: hypothetical protein VOA64_00240 [Candidatus Dormibacteraeota bacterium]|nr:hypothetical protein [Candidatus Dormibacteraeota bacterium]